MLEALIGRRDIAALPPSGAAQMRALRLWVAARKAGQCPMAMLAGRLGSPRTAAHFHLLLEEVGAAWPDAFAVSPPCCPRLSHDEATLADMLAFAAAGDKPGFDRLLGEMLGTDERERLFHGVRAIRLNPVGGSAAIHGRDGLLAHTYMLGPNGDSNGCVSLRDYDRFLQAYLRGEVRRLVVVAGSSTGDVFGRFGMNERSGRRG